MDSNTQIELSPRARPLNQYPLYWAECFGTAPFLPMSRTEMEELGWDSCDIIIVTGDAYVDHPSFGMAIVGRLLEAQGFRVGIIAQPDWQSAEPFKALGRPNLFFGVTAGNMDSMINRYTADRKIRSDDAYTPGDIGGKRPDRSCIVYSLAASHCALRLLAGQGAALDTGRRQGRPFVVWQRRTRDRRDRTSTGRRRGDRGYHRRTRQRVFHQGPAARLDRDRLDKRRQAGPRRKTAQPVPDHR
jgi:hypothetical protein